jgi:glutaryl-CoA dehydrogenase
MGFDSIDFLGLDNELSSEEKLARASVRSFVEAEVNPVIADCFEEGRFPTQLITKLADLGVLGANLPEEYGCADEQRCVRASDAGAGGGDSGIRSFASVQGALCMYPIFSFGSEDQKRKYLPEMAAGKIIGCFGLTEPNFGSNPEGMLTRAERVRDGWRLNGAKAWITNGSVADIAVVWAKTGTDDEIRGFIVEKGTRGFSTRDTKHKLSLRALCDIGTAFDDCLIPEENLLPGSKGLKSPLMCLTQARYGISWGALGAAMSCFDTALKYSQQRVQFGRPIGAFQLTQKKLVDMMLEITKAQLICLRLGRLKDEGKMKPAQVSMAKLNNVQIALECARTSRGILGANGITGEYPIMRHMCNLESVYTYEGTNEIHTLILGQALTGLKAFE